MDPYQTAQRAIADLKSAVYELLKDAAEPMTNAEVGRSLGIYDGHNGQHEGHISRTILARLEGEGLIKQVKSRGGWVVIGRP